jgi:UDP-3-O-[3-hydroxymyristoyl] N-acetylglucosamine deacetylase
MKLQKTIKRSINVQGVGLHSGRKASVTLHPAKAGSGVRLIRTDIESPSEILATYEAVIHTRLNTTLGTEGKGIATVEHLLAALKGLGIDNVRIEVDGPEVPIMDGSSEPFVKALIEAGIQEQYRSKKVVVLRRRVELKVGEKWAVAGPGEGLEIHASIEWDHPIIGYQEFRYREGETAFSEISRARTFGFLKDVEALQKIGLCRGGSLENAIVLNGTEVVNPTGLRYADEFIRHKVLDALGDLQLAGFPIQGSIRLHRSGHELHRMLVKAIFSDEKNYEIIESTVVRPEKLEEEATDEGLWMPAAAVAYN